MSNRNYYDLLNVPPDASGQEIRASYRKLAFEYHPDRNEGNPHAADRMKAINEAYAVLSDPDKRKQYDVLYQRFGENATSRFRQDFTHQDIFQGSDIQQIFEEMTRAFGLRGFEDIFKDAYGRGYRSFQFQQSGMFGKGFIFKTGMQQHHPGRRERGGLLENLARKVLGKLTGIHMPRRGDDLYDVIILRSEFARQGGPFAYHHRILGKKLVVQIPKGVHDGQLIRLNGMGREGTHGAGAGDLLLKVKFRMPLLSKIKNLMGLNG